MKVTVTGLMVFTGFQRVSPVDTWTKRLSAARGAAPDGHSCGWGRRIKPATILNSTTSNKVGHARNEQPDSVFDSLATESRRERDIVSLVCFRFQESITAKESISIALADEMARMTETCGGLQKEKRRKKTKKEKKSKFGKYRFPLIESCRVLIVFFLANRKSFPMKSSSRQAKNALKKWNFCYLIGNKQWKPRKSHENSVKSMGFSFKPSITQNNQV